MFFVKALWCNNKWRALYKDVCFLFAQDGVTIGSSQKVTSQANIWLKTHLGGGITIEFVMRDDVPYNSQRGKLWKFEAGLCIKCMELVTEIIKI